MFFSKKISQALSTSARASTKDKGKESLSLKIGHFAPENEPLSLLNSASVQSDYWPSYYEYKITTSTRVLAFISIISGLKQICE